jgi:DAK2 domain fusion protein YloV
MQINGEMLAKMFLQASNELNDNRKEVDALNVFPVPDGDTGTNMSLTMNAAVGEVAKLRNEPISVIAKSVSKGSLMGARGNSGVILSQIFRGFAKGCEGKETLNSEDLALAIKEASDTAYKAVMKPVEGTILTVVRETSEYAMENGGKEREIVGFLEDLIKQADETLTNTPEQLPVLKKAGVVDAGGMGLLVIFKGWHDALTGKEVELRNDIHTAKAAVIETGEQTSTEDIKFGYCTEFILKTEEEDVDPLKSYIESLGDSFVFVKDEDVVKIHIHTNNPGKALEETLKYGELLNIKIENMRQQHSSLVEEGKVPGYDHGEETEMKKYGIVSVAMGEGISKILKDLGVDVVIEGGQTMNPSTEDIMNAINSINAEEIIILPNNSNIILAANQAKEISDKNVHVIQSKTVPQGVTSLIEFDNDAEIEENIDSMSGVLGSVKTLQITYSVKDTTFDDVEIAKDDILGVADGTIISVGKSVKDVVLKSLDETIDENSEVLTIYYGQDITKDEAEELFTELEEKYEDLEIEMYEGAQPLYYYIFSVE